MKNIFKTLAAFAVIALAVACSKDGAEAPAVGEKATVSFDVQLPGGLASRATNDGTTAQQLFYAVYSDIANDAAPLFTGETTINITATVSIDLVTDQVYDIVFWAQKKGKYTPDWNAKTIAMGYANGAAGADEERDAFLYVWHDLEVKGAVNEPVTLKRPFAQLNVGLTKDQITKAANAGFELESVKVTAQTHNSFSFAAAQGAPADELATIEFAASAFEAPVNADGKHEITVEGTTYDWVSFNYLLACTPSELTNVEIVFNGKNGKTIALPAFASVPVERNHRTNIVGDLLTDPANFNVTIDPVFDEEDYVVKAWDGKTTKEPEQDAEGNYIIEEPSELAWLADQVNGVSRAEANNFKGQTFKMTADLDLRGHNWTPIGNSTNKFQGTFDGQGFAIQNLVVNMPGKSNAGLFGMTTDGEIKNLVVENAKITARLNVGVVAGTPYTSKYTNITVKGLIQVEGMSYVGGVGGKNCYANWDNIKVEAAEGSYVKANSVENGTAYRTYVGGVIGFMGEGSHKVSNVTSNINVEGSTCDIGGIVGIAHYGNSFENITCTGNVTNTCTNIDDASETGGIAGVWHNGGANVTLTNCKYTGTLSNNAGFTDYYYDGLVGAPYNKTGKGKLVIDGEEYVAAMTSEELAETAKEEGATVNVPAGTYAMPTVGNNVTLNCAAGTVFEGKTGIAGENVTIKNATFTNPDGTTALSGSLKGTTFENCVFNGTEAVRYAYANGDVVFNDCTFGDENCVRGIHFDAGTGTVTLNRCKLYGFNAFGSELALVTFNDSEFPYNNKYNVVNMYNKYVYNNCKFNPSMFCDCAANNVVAEFNGCEYTDGKDIKTLVRYDKDPATCTVTFNE